MSQEYALLKWVGREEYVVVKYTDHCLGVLAYFLTDDGYKEHARNWIETTDKGSKSGSITFLRKNGDDIVVGLDPVMTGKQDEFETTKENLLSYIDFWQKECKRHADEVLIKRDEEKITFLGKVVA